MLTYEALNVLQSCHCWVSQANDVECSLVAVLRKGRYQFSQRIPYLTNGDKNDEMLWLKREISRERNRGCPRFVWIDTNGVRRPSMPGQVCLQVEQPLRHA